MFLNVLQSRVQFSTRLAMSNLLADGMVRVEGSSDAEFQVILKTRWSEEITAARFTQDGCFQMLWVAGFKVGAIF